MGVSRPSKWKGLRDDPDVLRWYNQLALGSIATAEERLRVLGRYCEYVGTTPRKLVELGKDPNGGRRALEDQLMDFVARMRSRGRAPGYCESFVKSIKSWLLFNEIGLVRKIRVGDRNETPTLEHERIPTKKELHGALAVARDRAKLIIALIAFSGLRPEVLGNRGGTDGLRLRDLPEFEVRGEIARVTTAPARVIVRKVLSKTKRPYFTFAPAQTCRYVINYLERRVAKGETLTADSPLVRVELNWEKHGRPVNATHHGSPFLTTSQITKEVRRYLWTQVRMRPYVLRSYFDTNLELAERQGKITDSDRKYFMGRAGDIDRRYTTGKAQLPADVIEAMRKSFHASASMLITDERMEPGHGGPLGLPVLSAWATPEEYGRAMSELVELKLDAVSTFDELRRRLRRVEELQVELEKRRESTNR